MEPDRKKTTAVRRRPTAVASLACAAAAVLCAAPASAAERPDETDYLFRVSLPANAVDVFLPSREIGTKEEAAAYLDWARRTHAGSKGEVRAVWDDEPVGVSVQKNSNLRTNLLAFVRDGDSAVDPSGFNAFAVTNVHAATGAFRLVLAGGREPDGTRGPLDPRVCLTNVWVLPRRELFARWNREAATNAAGVRAEIAALRDSGFFRLSVGRGKAWESAVDSFVKTNGNLRPKVRFQNRSGVPVLLSFDGGAVRKICPGEVSDFVPSGEEARPAFPWRARRDDPDYEWQSGEIAWSASAAEDATKTFFDPPGRLKDEPHFDLPRDAVPAGLDAGTAKAFAKYAGEPESEVELERSDGILRFKARPRRKLEFLRIAGPAGWKDGILRPKGSAELAYGDTGSLVLATPMKRLPKPWPSVAFRNRFPAPVELEIGDGGSVLVATNVHAGALVRIDFDRRFSGEGRDAAALRCHARADRAKAPWERTLDLRRGGAEETIDIELDPVPAAPAVPSAGVAANAKPPPAPADRPWPAKTDADDLRKFLRHTSVKVVTMEENGQGQSVDNAKKILFRWQSFWGPPESQQEKTFRAAVAHIAVCPNGCGACRTDRARTFLDGNGLRPKEEAFLAFGGWTPERQRRFCRTGAEENGLQYDWSDFEDDRLGWIGFAGTQVDRPGAKATENLRAFWSGTNDDGKSFANLYRSVELGTLPVRRFDRIRSLPTFEERRRALFRMVAEAGASPPPSATVDRWIQKLDESGEKTK